MYGGKKYGKELVLLKFADIAMFVTTFSTKMTQSFAKSTNFVRLYF